MKPVDWKVDCRPVNNMAKANLVSIARQVDLTTNKSSSEFAVPKFLFTNICIVYPVLSNGHCRTDLVDQFLIWSKENSMICNSPKCKEIIFR